MISSKIFIGHGAFTPSFCLQLNQTITKQKTAALWSSKRKLFEEKERRKKVLLLVFLWGKPSGVEQHVIVSEVEWKYALSYSD